MPLIFGTVTDSEGRAIADARVAFSRAPVEMPDIALLTDDQGSFTLSVPVKGTYELAITADPHPPRSVSVNVDRERVTLDVRIK